MVCDKISLNLVWLSWNFYRGPHIKNIKRIITFQQKLNLNTFKVSLYNLLFLLAELYVQLRVTSVAL